MKKIKISKKVVILSGIFVLALAGYFLLSMKKGKNDVTYTSIKDAGLPVVYVEMFGRKMNGMYGYQEDNPASAGRGDLTVLPEDRKLTVHIEDLNSKIKGIQYEIRSLDGERLVERTALTDWTQEEGQVKTVLPIQNLLTKGQEYRMTLAVTTEGHPPVYYYTRIVWTDGSHAQDMINLAEDFSSKSFNYDAAKDLTTYLESNQNADNSSLGEVTLKSSFDQLTWRGLPITREGAVSTEFEELQGVMGMIHISYVASCADTDGSKDYFNVTETYTMKWNAQRIYMMDYDRRMNQIFSGNKELYSGKRIMLGISDGDDLQAVSDSTGRYKVFVANKELWSYDTETGVSTKIFAFRKKDNDLKLGDDSYGVKILAADSKGNVDFLVYGYMSRGNHGGSTGVSLYRYESDDNSLTERIYLPAGEDYWSIRQDINKLSYLSDRQVLYLLLDHAVYGVDLTSKEYIVVADSRTEDNLAVSDDGSRIAWQDGTDPYSSTTLHVMDLKSGQKNEITYPDQRVIQLIGFVGRDLVYGLAEPGDKLTSDGRTVGLALSSLQIVGDNMETETRYEKDGVYITDVGIQDSRIHMTKLVKTGAGFSKTDDDTLVCNEEISDNVLPGIGYIAGQKRGRQYFVQLDQEISRDQNQKLVLQVPKKAVAEDGNVVTLTPNETCGVESYYAYSSGRMQGSFANFKRALDAAFDGMGLVTDKSGNVVWVRANRSDSKSIRNVQDYVPKLQSYLDAFMQGKRTADDGTKMIDARGCSLSQVLYFVYRGIPVAAYYKDGAYGLIYGYDPYNITCLWYPGTDQEYSEKMGLNDASAYFSKNGENDFVCFLPGK